MIHCFGFAHSHVQSDDSFVSASQKLSDADDEESRLSRNLASREALPQNVDMDATETVTSFVYDSYLGLAIEPLKQGVTTKDLWHQTFDNY